MQGLVSDIELHLRGKFINLKDVHSFVKSMYALNMLKTADSMNAIITYIVDSGYDSEDFNNILGLSKSVGLIHRLCSS